MLTSRTDVRKERDEPLAASPFLLLWSPPSSAEQALMTEGRPAAVTTRPLVANDLLPAQAYPFQAPFPQERLLRLMDIVGASALLIFFLPLIVILAVMITLSDFGPPFFAHLRIGRNGEPFKCYKLRSMRRDAEKRLKKLLAENPEFRREWAHNRKLSKDPRITWFGAFLRSSSLDELPQLFNVLQGKMSLVGPRPVVQEELRMYGRHIACYLRCRPGLTGVWQVTGRSDTSYRRRVAADRLYARRKSFAFDWKLLCCTVPAVLARKGAC